MEGVGGGEVGSTSGEGDVRDSGADTSGGGAKWEGSAGGGSAWRSTWFGGAGVLGRRA